MKTNKRNWNPALVLIVGLIVFNLLINNTGLYYYGGFPIHPKLLTDGVFTTVLIIVLAIVGLALAEKFPVSEDE